MPVHLYQVDAFTDRPFAGNPAAVCLLDAPADPAWMQAVAAENNLAETAFVTHAADGTRGLRWFTPTVEVDLCGHATLATAHVLFHEVGVADPVLRFATRSGELTAARSPAGIELDFPVDEPRPVEQDTDAAVRAAIAGSGPDRAAEVWRGVSDLLVVVDSEDAVRACQPDLVAVARLGVRGVVVTAAGPGVGGPDIVSRFFGPATGVDEDAVTGSAHCLLAPYWSPRLGRNPLRAHQASARGGDLLVERRGDRVALTGTAVTVLVAELAGAAWPAT
jgi:PhzF family phenazine biosynthesis protein